LLGLYELHPLPIREIPHYRAFSSPPEG